MHLYLNSFSSHHTYFQVSRCNFINQNFNYFLQKNFDYFKLNSNQMPFDFEVFRLYHYIDRLFQIIQYFEH